MCILIYGYIATIIQLFQRIRVPLVTRPKDIYLRKKREKKKDLLIYIYCSYNNELMIHFQRYTVNYVYQSSSVYYHNLSLKFNKSSIHNNKAAFNPSHTFPLSTKKPHLPYTQENSLTPPHTLTLIFFEPKSTQIIDTFFLSKQYICIQKENSFNLRIYI